MIRDLFGFAIHEEGKPYYSYVNEENDLLFGWCEDYTCSSTETTIVFDGVPPPTGGFTGPAPSRNPVLVL